MLPGFESTPADRAGGTFNGSPWRVILHTTEGGSIDGAVGAYRATGSWPHFTVDPSKGRRAQHYDLDTSARALLHRPTDPETNRANAIQIEIVGFATESPGWPKPWLRWLGTAVLEPIRAVCPFALAAPDFVRYPDSYGFGAHQRLTWDSWRAFSGICGHEHVPGNDHGDPGALDITTIIAALGGVHDDPKPTEARKVNAVVSDPVSGETQIAELRDDGLVWLRNIKNGSPWYNVGALPKDAGKPVSLDAGYRSDGTLDVSVRTDKGVTWLTGAPQAKPFGGWYVPG